MIDKEIKQYIDDKLTTIKNDFEQALSLNKVHSINTSKLEDVYNWKEDIERGWKNFPCKHNKK